jgi:hypothetical protein
MGKAFAPGFKKKNLITELKLLGKQLFPGHVRNSEIGSLFREKVNF